MNQGESEELESTTRGADTCGKALSRRKWPSEGLWLGVRGRLQKIKFGGVVRFYSGRSGEPVKHGVNQSDVYFVRVLSSILCGDRERDSG